MNMCGYVWMILQHLLGFVLKSLRVVIIWGSVVGYVRRATVGIVTCTSVWMYGMIEVAAVSWVPICHELNPCSSTILICMSPLLLHFDLN